MLVFLHGGAFSIGSGIDKFFNGYSYAGEHGLVLVTLNYRLGALGYLAHPYLSAANPSAPTNFGLLDQRAALTWIQKNIRYFGGSSSKITVAGESAGAISLLAHLRDPNFSQRKLFQRAIVMSPVPQMTTLSLEESEQEGRKRAARVGCGAGGDSASDLEMEVACMRLLSASEITETIPRSLFFHTVRSATAGPVSDAANFEVHTDALAGGSGHFADVDIIMGSVLDEGTLFTFLPFPVRPISDEFFPRAVRNAFVPLKRPGLVEGILELYSLDSYRAPGSRNYSESAAMTALSDILGDSAFTCPTTQLMGTVARYRSKHSTMKGSVFGYAWAVPEYAAPWLRPLGTAHGSELEFFFGSDPTSPYGIFLRSMSEEERELGRKWRESIVEFIVSGNPSTPDMRWNPFDPSAKNVLVIESNSKTGQASFKQEKCDFWAAQFPEGGVPPVVVTEPLAGEEILSVLLNEHIARASVWLYRHKTEAYIAVGGILVGIFVFTLRYFFTKMWAVAKAQKEREEAAKKKQKILGSGQNPTSPSKKKRE